VAYFREVRWLSEPLWMVLIKEILYVAARSEIIKGEIVHFRPFSYPHKNIPCCSY